ncbi:MAG: hypothetical protein ABI770_03715 [Sphingomicrobium sp.]
MENDSIRASGGNTLVDVWIEGKLRGITVARGAIQAFLALPPDRAQAMSEEERCEFVRTHLPLVLTAAKIQLREGNPAADSISIEAGDLGGDGRAQASDRRRAERRKTDRRKSKNPEPPRTGERRRAARRTGERRIGPTRPRKS